MKTIFIKVRNICISPLLARFLPFGYKLSDPVKNPINTFFTSNFEVLSPSYNFPLQFNFNISVLVLFNCVSPKLIDVGEISYVSERIMRLNKYVLQ